MPIAERSSYMHFFFQVALHARSNKSARLDLAERMAKLVCCVCWEWCDIDESLGMQGFAKMICTYGLSPRAVLDPLRRSVDGRRQSTPLSSLENTRARALHQAPQCLSMVLLTTPWNAMAAMISSVEIHEPALLELTFRLY